MCTVVAVAVGAYADAPVTKAPNVAPGSHVRTTPVVRSSAATWFLVWPPTYVKSPPLHTRRPAERERVDSIAHIGVPGRQLSARQIEPDDVIALLPSDT